MLSTYTHMPINNGESLRLTQQTHTHNIYIYIYIYFMNRGLSLNFRWLGSANHVKFTGICVMSTKKHILVKKKEIFKNGINMGLLQCA